MSLAGNVNLLADRIADEFNTVRSQMAVPLAPRVGTSATSIDANLLDAVDLTLAANVTLAVPTNGYNGKVIQVTAYASGGAWDFTFNASYARLAGISQTISIPSSKKLRVAIRRSTLGTDGWIVEAAGVTQ